MIFLSHQTNDKDFVSIIAHELKKIYGKDNVFYDDWSIKPGENIILNMNEGIKRCKYFFYFITSNSLKSNMVDLEWTSAIMKMSREKIKFIPIRAEGVNPPEIISGLKYLDLYKDGLDVTITQMKEIISGNQTNESPKPFNNIISYYIEKGNELIIYVTAKRFFEPNAPFVMLTESKERECSFLPGFPCINSHQYVQDIMYDGKTNGFYLDVQTDLRPKKYIKLIFKRKVSPVVIKGFFHSKAQDDNTPIEMIKINSETELP